MEQTRPESNSSQQQNVHLHMHHICNCQGTLYPPTYYPTVSYRTPVAPMVPYPAPPAVARPYLQHYQYTQFNVGSQYTVPIAHMATPAGSVYGAAATQTGTAEMMFAPPNRDRRDRGDLHDGAMDSERMNEPPAGYDYGQVTPPANELLLSENSDSTSPENFVKFLERSCLTAEQIAYRNRNRPCFRNIQNLCIRTRSEILKPCTTISNIHSQGIPWATKDFIYAFVRLTNCWHILKGYWENRDGSSLGKIEKELTPEFRACYVRWEKETIDLAAQLTRVFYNLDTNLNSPATGANNHTSSNLISSQVNLLKNPSTDNVGKKSICETNNAATITLVTPAETVDQANQTCAGDFCSKEEDYDSEEDERRVYMKPGSYNVPKKGPNSNNESAVNNNNSPRAIEFLETAQNVNKAREVVSDRYWTNTHITNQKTDLPKTPQEEIEKTVDSIDVQLNLSTHLNVHEWLISSNFSEFGEPSSQPTSPPELRPFFIDNSVPFDLMPSGEGDKAHSITVLQRGKGGLNQKNGKTVPVNGRIEITSRTYRKRTEGGSRPLIGGGRKAAAFEGKNGGLTDISTTLMEKLVEDLKESNLDIDVIFENKNDYTPIIDLELILKKIKDHEYIYINEIIRDLRYLNNYISYFAEHFDKMENKSEIFSHKMELFLAENFVGFDFHDIKGDLNEKVGPLKYKKTKFETDGE